MLFELASQITQHGHQVTVVTSDASDGHSRYPAGTFHEDGVTVSRLRSLSQFLCYQHRKFIVPEYSRELRHLMASHDVAHFVGSRDFFITVGSHVARQQGLPYIVTAYGCLPRESFGWKRVVKPVYDRLLTNRVMRVSRLCLAQTRHEAAGYSGFGVVPERIRLVPLASDPSRFAVLPPRGALRRRLGITPQEKIVLFVGRMHYEKGLDLLIHAMRQVARRVANARLVVVGRDDGQEAALRELVLKCGLSDKVFFAGALYGRDALTAYVDADVFALTPRRFEETTLAGVEACFCGTQVVVTEQAEIPHLDESGSGTTVRNETAVIAEAIAAALEDDRSIRERGTAAREMAHRRLSWPAVLPLYVKAYEDAAASPVANRCAVPAWG